MEHFYQMNSIEVQSYFKINETRIISITELYRSQNYIKNSKFSTTKLKFSFSIFFIVIISGTTSSVSSYNNSKFNYAFYLILNLL